MNANEASQISEIGANDLFAELLQGYRFRVCRDAGSIDGALDVRRRVYVEGSGYDIPVPDQYDAWSWFLLAEDTSTGEPVGSMRLTPHWAGPFEAEEYYRLPRALRAPGAVEINRFAILPAHRKGRTFLPVVSVGLFKLVYLFLTRAGGERMVICSKAERIWTYEWLRFTRTGLIAPYGKLGAAPHELLSLEVGCARALYEGHPFLDFFAAEHAEIEVPGTLPAMGAAVHPTLRALLRRSA